MKLRILILFCLTAALSSCQDKHKQPNLLESIRSVEKNLCKKGYEPGDSVWTIEERMRFYGVPAVSIVVIRNNKIYWSRAYGIIDKESKEPASVHTLFQAGSISKPVAAYGALYGVLKGNINLDKNVNTYLTSWKLPDNQFTKEKKVTLKHLLSHTGGITVHGFLGYSTDLAVPTLIQILNGEPPANSPAIRVDQVPGKEWRYSGGGYTIMQQMLIDIEKKPFPEIMKERILDPLNMSESTYEQPLSSERLKLAATGYLPDGSMTKGKRHTYPEMAAAGLWTTAEDLAKFAIDVQLSVKGTRNRVLSKSAAEQMLTPVSDTYGLGFDILKTGSDTYFQHAGWDEGFCSHLIGHKEKGYGVVVLTNANKPDFISEVIRSVALTEQWDHYLPDH